MNANKIICGDCLEVMKTFPDNSIDLILTDPPYGLGSKVIIKSNGKPDYETTSDFMNQWDMPSGEFWESWFIESFRLLKYGGYCIMFGIDRQLLIPKYYSLLAGFIEHQSLYWYQAQSFPKSTDLSKKIDDYFGEERDVVRKYQPPNGTTWNLKQSEDSTIEHIKHPFIAGGKGTRTLDITAPTSLLAKNMMVINIQLSH